MEKLEKAKDDAACWKAVAEAREKEIMRLVVCKERADLVKYHLGQIVYWKINPATAGVVNGILSDHLAWRTMLDSQTTLMNCAVGMWS